MNKKGYTIKDLLPIGLILGVSIIAISISADVVDNVQDGQTSGTYAYNISESGLEGINELGDFLPTIGLVVAASVVIGILVYSFAMRN